MPSNQIETPKSNHLFSKQTTAHRGTHKKGYTILKLALECAVREAILSPRKGIQISKHVEGKEEEEEESKSIDRQ
jgi:hypothetical protein